VTQVERKEMAVLELLSTLSYPHPFRIGLDGSISQARMPERSCPAAHVVLVQLSDRLSSKKSWFCSVPPMAGTFMLKVMPLMFWLSMSNGT
jgi:hypothetical protein